MVLTEAQETKDFHEPLTPSEHARDPERRFLPFESRGESEFKEGVDALTLLLTDPRAVPVDQVLHALYQTELGGLDVFGRTLVHCRDYADQRAEAEGRDTWDVVPWEFEKAYARILWDEVRHTELARAHAHRHDVHLGDFIDGFRKEDRQETPLSLDPAIVSATINSAGEGLAMNLFSALITMGQELGDADWETAFDYNHADEMMHVSVGDYWVPRLTEGEPERREAAMKARLAAEENIIALQDADHVPAGNLHIAI